MTRPTRPNQAAARPSNAVSRNPGTAAGNELGRFLRAARERVEPADAGLFGGASGRRVRGLRREEVAVLAGVSADYYARLEQGRERNPSAQVIGAIGRALRLSPDAREHLYRLAELNPQFGADNLRDLVHPSLLRLLEAFPRADAYVLGPAFDIIAANAISEALMLLFGDERNMARIVFTLPEARAVLPERDLLQRNIVYALRLNAGRFPNDDAITHIVDELRDSSTEFRMLWDDQNVGNMPRACKVFVLPEVGRIELTYQTFEVVDAPGQRLRVGTAEPGSRSEEALLAYLVSTAQPA